MTAGKSKADEALLEFKEDTYTCTQQDQLDISFGTKLLGTCVALGSAVSVGFGDNVLGSTLVDIMTYTSSTPSDIGLLYIVAALAGILSAVVLVPLHNRYNTFFLLALGFIAAGIVRAATPWSTNIVVFVTLTASVRFIQCLVEAGYLMALAAFWKERTGTAVQGLGICYSTGAFLTPLVSIPFLNSDTNNPNNLPTTPNTTIGTLNSTTVYAIDYNNIGTAHSSYNVSLPMDGPTIETLNTLSREYTTGVQSVYVISGAMFILMGSLQLLVFSLIGKDIQHALFNAKKTQTKTNKRCSCDTFRQISQNLFNDSGTETSQYGYRMAFYIFTGASYLFVGGMLIAYAGYLPVFCFSELKFSTNVAGVVLTVFTISGLASCLAQAFLLLIVRAIYMGLALAILGAVSAIVCVLFLHYHWLVIWVCTAILGFCLLAIFGLMQAIGNDTVKADGMFQSVYVFGYQSGYLIVPGVTGFLFDNVGPMAVLYVAGVSTIMLLFCISCLAFLQRRIITTGAMSEVKIYTSKL